MRSCDAIVVGAGTNGLACAGLLAKAGRKVEVFEAREVAGGAAATVEFAPGYRVPHVAHLVNQLDPRVVADLALERHGLAFAAANLATVALAADGRHLILDGAFGETLAGDVSPADLAAWSALRAKLLRYAGLLGAFRRKPPPRLKSGAAADAATLAGLGLAIRRLGAADMREFLRVVLINVADLLDDELADDRLKGAVAFDAVLGSHMGPRSPSSLLHLLYRLSGEVAGRQAALAMPAGGMGRLAEAFAAAATAAGARIATGQAVRRILVEADRVAGVELADGETVRAPLVVSAANPKRTFLDLVGPAPLYTGFGRRVRNIRMRGTAAKLHLALTGLPDFAGLDPKRLAGRLVIAPSLDAVERAFDAAKYGAASPRPVMEITVPSLADPSLAPAGHHVLSAVVQYAPHDLRGGWTKGVKAFERACLAELEACAPGIGKLVAAAELVSPAELEARYGLVGGDWHHGELAVDQMFMLRPVPGAAQYATPVPGLWLAGAGSHPGGGISGAAGYNAAKAILAGGSRR